MLLCTSASVVFHAVGCLPPSSHTNGGYGVSVRFTFAVGIFLVHCTTPATRSELQVRCSQVAPMGCGKRRGARHRAQELTSAAFRVRLFKRRRHTPRSRLRSQCNLAHRHGLQVLVDRDEQVGNEAARLREHAVRILAPRVRKGET